jgi:hypothetical protein
VAITRMCRPAGDLLERRCEDIVAAEMTRLAGRVPGLRPGHLRHIEAALGRVIDDLMLSRARVVPGDQLAILPGLADVL